MTQILLLKYAAMRDAPSKPLGEGSATGMTQSGVYAVMRDAPTKSLGEESAGGMTQSGVHAVMRDAPTKLLSEASAGGMQSTRSKAGRSLQAAWCKVYS